MVPSTSRCPPGETAYVTARSGVLDAVDIKTLAVRQLLAGGQFGPMDFDELTDEVYVPDARHSLLDVLAPVFGGSPLPEEPLRAIPTEAPPMSVAITNDGLFGFVALHGGGVVALDLLRRQVAYTVEVGGTPHFIITGLYPPSTSTSGTATSSSLPPSGKSSASQGKSESSTLLNVILPLTGVLLVLALL